MTNALALRSELPSAQEWQTMTQMAITFFKSGMLPQHIKSEQAALFIVMKGRELGVPATYALSNIAVIQGKPTANAELMLALIYRDHGDNALQFVETNAEHCTISYARRGWDGRRQHSFTYAEAQKANLIKAGPWSQYPAAMLRARCISAVARLAFPDSIAGMYLPEEMGATVRVGADGVVETVADDAPETPLRARTVDAATGEVTESALSAQERIVQRAFAVGLTLDAGMSADEMAAAIEMQTPQRIRRKDGHATGKGIMEALEAERTRRETVKAASLPLSATVGDDPAVVAADDDGFDEAGFNASVDAQIAQRRATVAER